MSRRKRFLRNGLLLTAVALSARAVSLFFGAFVTKTVGAEGIGLFTLIMTVYGFAVTFATSGVSLTVTKLVAAAIGEGRRDRVAGILRAAVGYAMLFSVGATVILFFSAPFLGVRVLGDIRTVRSLRLLSSSLVPGALCAIFSGYFVGIRRVARNAATQVIAQGAKILLTLTILAKSAALGAEAACFALSLCSVLTDLVAFLVLFFQFLRERRGEETGRKAREMSAVAGMAFPLAVSAYIRSALLTLEHVLIPKRLQKRGDTRSEALASYGVLHGMALPMILFPMAPLTSFSGLLVPEFAECHAAGDRVRMKRIAEEAYHLTLVYAVGISAFLLLFSEEIGYVVYHSYEAGVYIAFLAPVVPLMYLDHVTDSVLKGIGEHVYSMWVNISDSLLSVILVFFLLPSMGIRGYGVVIIVMEGYNFLLSYLRLRRRIRFPLRPLRSFFLPLCTATLSSVLAKALFVMNGRATGGFWLTMKILFAVSLFVALTMAAECFLFHPRKHGGTHLGEKSGSEGGTP